MIANDYSGKNESYLVCHSFHTRPIGAENKNDAKVFQSIFFIHVYPVQDTRENYSDEQFSPTTTQAQRIFYVGWESGRRLSFAYLFSLGVRSFNTI